MSHPSLTTLAATCLVFMATITSVLLLGRLLVNLRRSTVSTSRDDRPVATTSPAKYPDYSSNGRSQWQRYASTSLGLSFDYPITWNVATTTNGDIELRNYDIAQLKLDDGIPTGGIYVYITRHVTRSEPCSYETHVADCLDAVIFSYATTTIDVAGIRALLVEGTTTYNTLFRYPGGIVAILRDQALYDVYFIGADSRTPSLRRILSSLTFNLDVTEKPGRAER